jgi:hypothetical protein
MDVFADAIDEISVLRWTRGEVSAKEHALLFKSRVWYKLLHGDFRHWGVTYKKGLNVDPVPFKPTGECEPGGLYFTHIDYIAYWWRHLQPPCLYIAEVTVPDDARVYIEPCGTKLKADKFELSNILPLNEFFDTLDEIMLEWMVAAAPALLQYVGKQTEEMCLAAVRHDAYLLRYVKKVTPPCSLQRPYPYTTVNLRRMLVTYINDQ